MPPKKPKVSKASKASGPESSKPAKAARSTSKSKTPPLKGKGSGPTKNATSAAKPKASSSKLKRSATEGSNDEPLTKKLKKTKEPKASSSKSKQPTAKESEEEEPLNETEEVKDSKDFEKSPKVRKQPVKSDPVWYFKPATSPPTTSQNLPTALMTTFHHALYHVISVGLLLHELQNTPEGTWIQLPTLVDGSADATMVNEKKVAIKKLLSTDTRTKDITDFKLLRYLEIALGTWADGDKFMPFRMHAPSMSLVESLFPKYQTNVNISKKGSSASRTGSKVEEHSLNIFRLAVIRIFGVGDPALIQALANATKSSEVITKLESSLPADKKSLSRSVYGQLLIPCKTITEIVTNCEKLGSSLANKIHNQKEEATFEYVQSHIEAANIPYMKAQCLLTWLFGCDLAALGYCAEATWDDLADKMGIIGGSKTEFKSRRDDNGKGKAKVVNRESSSGGGGPVKGLELVTETAMKKAEAQKSEINDDGFQFRTEMEIKLVTKRKSLFIPNCDTVVKKLNEEFQEQFEMLGMTEGILPRDMEHFLCKIARMEGRGNFEFWKEPKVKETKESKSKGSRKKK